MRPVRRIDPEERRARLARRHALAPGHRAATVEEVAERLVCLHATDPATVYLSAWARMDAMRVADMERALYADRSLVKHLAMRRTLFVFPRDVLPAAQAGASAKVAASERRRLSKEVERDGLHADGEAWLDAADAAVLAALADGRERTSTELRRELPLLEGAIEYGRGKTWGGQTPVGPRVLTILSAGGRILRASNDGAWTASRPRWAATAAWLGEEIEPMDEADGVRELVRRWLAAFGPGTTDDLKWWLGGTLTAVRRALAELGAVEVRLGGGETGWVLPDDVDPVDAVAPWAALLPSLDPTVMGWFARDWYLGEHREHVFDRNGNAGHTAWWGGRIVGGWRQDAGGVVEVQHLDDVGAEALAALEAEAARLTEWLAGTRLAPRFPAPLARR